MSLSLLEKGSYIYIYIYIDYSCIEKKISSSQALSKTWLCSFIVELKLELEPSSSLTKTGEAKLDLGLSSYIWFKLGLKFRSARLCLYRRWPLHLNLSHVWHHFSFMENVNFSINYEKLRLDASKKNEKRDCLCVIFIIFLLVQGISVLGNPEQGKHGHG